MRIAHPSIDPATLHFARRLVRIKASQITRSARHAVEGRNDLEQELMLEVLLRWPKYDPARASREAFVEQVVRSRVCTLIRARRRRPVTRPLTAAAFLRPDPADPIRCVDVRLDVQVVVNRLRPRLREACDHLRRESQSDAARAMGANRSSMMRSLAQTRRMFADSGLDSYL
ncbi:MAG: sigma-70 family RNA polymerase sigma factor [Phycisphaerales bacterium]|nr:sigma-70 family RNA polymerase sigma factor [Phycisphaerales bacterium]